MAFLGLFIAFADFVVSWVKFYIIFPHNNLKRRWIFDMLLRYQSKGFFFCYLCFNLPHLSWVSTEKISFFISNKKMYINLSGFYMFISELLTNPHLRKGGWSQLLVHGCLNSWLLNNMSLNCVHPLKHRFWFSSSKATVLHDLWLLETTDAQLQIRKEQLSIWRADYKLYIIFQLCGGLMPWCL